MLSIKIGDDILKYKVIPFLDILDCRNFNIAYHKFSIIINNSNSENYEDFKFTDKGCLPKYLNIKYLNYLNYNLNYKHNIVVRCNKNQILEDLKISSLVENFRIFYSQSTTPNTDSIKIQKDFIPTSLVKFEFFGHIQISNIFEFMNLKILDCYSVDCDLSDLVNLEVLNISQYKGQFPINLKELNSCDLYENQLLPPKLEKLWITSTSKFSGTLILPSSIKEYTIHNCITKCSASEAKIVNIDLYDETILPSQCHKLNVNIKYTQPYVLDTQCNELYLNDKPNNGLLYISGKKFDKVTKINYQDVINSSILFTNCEINLYKISTSVMPMDISFGCTIGTLILDDFKYGTLKLDLFKNNKVKKIVCGLNSKIGYHDGLKKLGYTYDDYLYCYTIGGGD